jgi:peptide/nickel transport system substrate-binding protein
VAGDLSSPLGESDDVLADERVQRTLNRLSRWATVRSASTRAETPMFSTPAPSSSWKRRSTIAVTAVLTVASAAACGNDGDDGGGDRRQFDAALTTEVPAATSEVESLTWNLPTGEPPTLDPAQSALENISTVVGNMCEALFRFDREYVAQPALAESVEQTDDTTYVFTLREGATFWDGTPVTAEDVVYSVNRTLDPAVASPWAGWAANFAGIEATDERTVTLSLRNPDPLAENYFALPAFTVVSKAFAEQAGPALGTAGTGVMCTGPYEFSSWEQGQSIELVRNDDWWDAETEARVGSVTFTFTTDPAAQSASLRSGETDGQWLIPTSAFEQLGESGNLLFGPSLSPFFMVPLNLEGPMGQPEVRDALQSAVDYQGISESVYRGIASPLRTLVPPAAYGYAEDTYQEAYDALPEPAQDLDRVASIVAETPAATEPMTLAYFAASDEETRAATAIADSANQAGMNIELRPLTPPEFGAVFTSPEGRQGIDVFLVTGYLDFPEPLQYYQYFTTGTFYNFAGYSNPEYDDLVGQALTTVDDEERAELVLQAQQVLLDDDGVIPVATVDVSVYYQDELTGLVPRQNFLYYPWVTELGGE